MLELSFKVLSEKSSPEERLDAIFVSLLDVLRTGKGVLRAKTGLLVRIKAKER